MGRRCRRGSEICRGRRVVRMAPQRGFGESVVRVGTELGGIRKSSKKARGELRLCCAS